MTVLKPFFPNLGTELVTDETIHNWFTTIEERKESTELSEPYSPDRCNDLGKMLFVSEMKVEMNKFSKQYERNCRFV
jgi:hypothetical protein